MNIRTLIVALIIALSFAFATNGQHREILLLSDNTYEYISRLQKRGILLDLNPSSLPYTYFEVNSALEKVSTDAISNTERNWFNLIKERLNRESRQKEVSRSFEIDNQLDVSDSKRLNTLDPLGDDLFLYPKVRLKGVLGNDFFVGSLNLTHSFYYDQDPDGIDLGDRLYVRPEDSYLGMGYAGLDLYIGRYDHQWASYGHSSVILSNNARSFDKIKIGYASKYISFQSIVGELDNLSPNGFFEGKGIQEGSQRRYIAAHRFDWRPFNNLVITYFESVIYSGYNSGISPKFLNPFLLFGFVSSNNPINDDVNLLMGTSIWWNHKNITFDIQFMLDDIHIEDKEEVTTFSLMSNINGADIIRNTDLGICFEAVAYQTYNAPKSEGRYLYLKRGIATQNTDYVLTKLYSKFYLDEWINGLAVTPSLTYYLQGEQVINQPIVRTNSDGSLIDAILTGEVEKTLRAGINVFYNPHPNFWLELNTGFNKVDNYMNVSGNTNNRFSTIAKIGFRLGLYQRN